MKVSTRIAALHWAETIDAMRVFPRIILGTYLGFAGWLIVYLVQWYTHLPAAERGLADGGVLGLITSTVTGFFPSVLKVYQDGGRDWTRKPQETS